MTAFISIKRRIFNKVTSRLTDKQYFQLLFLLKLKKFPNLDQPRTLNEKIIWRILFDRREIFSRLTDKVGMREYMKEIGLAAHLPKTYFIGTNPQEIHFNKLPNSFAVKPNHASGQIIIVKDKNLLDKGELINTCSEWLAFSYYDRGREWPYKNIQPKIIIEELLGEVTKLRVYKFHCFHGKPKILVVARGYTTGNAQFAAFDLAWNKQKIDYGPAKNADFSRPKRLAEMLAFSAKLSEPFDYVRVDLYQLKDRLVISELTFTHGSGFDAHWGGKLGLVLGDYWKITTNLGPT